MAAQAGAAGGGGDGTAGLDKGGHVAQVDAVLEDLLGGGDDDAADVIGNLLALQDLGGDGHVFQTAVGAGADDDLVDLDVLHLGDGTGVLGQVGVSHGGLDLAEVNFNGADVLCIGICLVSSPGTVHTTFHVSNGGLVHREDAVLGTGLDGHVGNAQTVVHGQGGNALTAVLQALVQRAVHADHADQVEDHVLAADTGLQLAGQVDLDGLGDLEPGLAGGHTGCHVGGTHAGGESAQCAVGAGVGVSADDAVTGSHDALFRQQGVLDTHLAHIVEVVDVEALGEGAALEALLSGLDVLVGGEMVHDHGDLALIENAGEAFLLKLTDGHGRGDVVAQDHIQLGTDQLTGLDLRQACVGCQDLLCHCHSHRENLLCMFR